MSGQAAAVLAEWFRMAYAEAGYPNAVVVVTSDGRIETVPSTIDYDERATWRAGMLIHGPHEMPCFDCWCDQHSRSKGRGSACRNGDCTAPQVVADQYARGKA